MSWNIENPPKDGTPIVAIGHVIERDGLCTVVDPFTAAIFWFKDQSGFEGWHHFESEHKLSLATSPDDEVKIFFWAEYPPHRVYREAA